MNVPEGGAIFIDAGASIARHRKSDAHHRVAVDAWRAIGRASPHAVTTNFCIAEAGNFLTMRFGTVQAAGKIGSWLRSPDLLIERVASADELRGLELLRRYSDQTFSYVDAVSFAIMNRLKIDTAFTFDKHFAIAGFTLWPGA